MAVGLHKTVVSKNIREEGMAHEYKRNRSICKGIEK